MVAGFPILSSLSYHIIASVHSQNIILIFNSLLRVWKYPASMPKSTLITILEINIIFSIVYFPNMNASDTKEKLYFFLEMLLFKNKNDGWVCSCSSLKRIEAIHRERGFSPNVSNSVNKFASRREREWNTNEERERKWERGKDKEREKVRRIKRERKWKWERERERQK